MEQKMQKLNRILPCGQFCYSTGNCSDCGYYQSSKKDSNGRGYCNWYGHYYFPSERQGCMSHSKR